jgi:putative tryptophan/tyrosine transport system substrate-binding protein
MKRREFIALFGGAAAAPLAFPYSASAQQPAMPVVGYLQSRSAAGASHLMAAFREGLQDSGFIDGQNVRIEFRWGDGHFDRMPALAKELAAIPVAVLAATGGEPVVMSAKAAASTIPLVFAMSGDPIKLGLATSFNRPGRNATGVNILTTALEPKRLGLLRELAPLATTLAAFVHAHLPQIEGQVNDLQQAAAQTGVKLHLFRISTERDIDAAFETIAREKMGALAVAGSPFFDTHHTNIIALAARHAVPASYHFREYVESGGLMSYGIDIRDAHRQVGRYTGQILKGAKAGDMPIMLPSKFEFVINLKTAKALNLTISPTVLARADEVIE